MQSCPEHILPCSRYRMMEQTDLLSQAGLVLIRHIESQDVCRIGDSEVLHPDCIKIQSDHLRDLSNNLLGIFEIEDIFYGIVKECREYYCNLWNEDTDGLMPSDRKYFRDGNRGFYFIPIDELLGLELPEVQEQKCHFMIFHTPTRCNFWHISIRLLNDSNQEISTLNLNDKKKRKIWKSAKDFLIEDIITRKIKSHTVVPEIFYSKEMF